MAEHFNYAVLSHIYTALYGGILLCAELFPEELVVSDVFSVKNGFIV